MITRAALIALALTAISTNAQAQALTGNEFYESCRTGDADFCAGYAMGVGDTLVAKRLVSFCARDVTGNQVADIVVKYLRDNPEERNKLASELVEAALLEAFPCR